MLNQRKDKEFNYRRSLLIGGLVLLGFTVLQGILANRDWCDPLGIGMMIGFSVIAGLMLGLASTNKK